jgi:hypothetical protein
MSPNVFRHPRATAFTALLLASLLGSTGAHAQGYTAGPGLETPTLVPATDGGVASPAGDHFATTVVSPHASPAFTQDREFTTTRVWVLDPGKATVEQWWNGFWGQRRAQPNAYPNDQFLQTEIAFGVAPHVQVDIYANAEFAQDATGTYQVATGGHTGIAAEVRVALGNYWGQIPLNPTLYFEITSQYYNSPRAEVRVLLGDTILTPRLLGAANLAFERNLFRDSSSGIDYELKADLGLNYELVKDVLRVGVEGVVGFDSHGTLDAQGRSELHPVLAVGPSLLLTEPKKRVKLLATLMRGLAPWDQPWMSTIIISTTFGTR